MQTPEEKIARRKEVTKKYREKNKEKIRENRKGKYKETLKQYRKKNRKKINAYQKKRYHENKPQLKKRKERIADCIDCIYRIPDTSIII